MSRWESSRLSLVPPHARLFSPHTQTNIVPANAGRLTPTIDNAAIFRLGNVGTIFRCLFAQPIGLVRRWRLVSGRWRRQRGTRRLLGEFGDLVLLAAEHVAPDTGLLVQLLRGEPVARRRGVCIALAAAHPARIAAGSHLILSQRILFELALI